MKINLTVWTEKKMLKGRLRIPSRENERIFKLGTVTLDLLPHLLIRRVWNQNFKLLKGDDFEGGAKEVNK